MIPSTLHMYLLAQVYTLKTTKYLVFNSIYCFQLEDRNIELAGTRARVRVLEDLHQPTATPKSPASPDVIPVSDATATTPEHHRRHLSRSEITTASMKVIFPQCSVHSTIQASAI